MNGKDPWNRWTTCWSSEFANPDMDSGTKYFFSPKLFDGEHLNLNNNHVLVFKDNTLIARCMYEEILPQEIYHTSHLLMPGLVNTHTHLELSALHGKIPKGTGFSVFAKEVVRYRTSIPENEMMAHALARCREMENEGIVLCGDISNTSLTLDIKTRSRIVFHTFIELIGYRASEAEKVFNQGLTLLEKFRKHELPVSLSCHAPYTIHPEVFKKVGDYNSRHGLPGCMHYLESQDECCWMKGETAPILSIFSSLNISDYQPRESILFFQPENALLFFSRNFFAVHATCVNPSLYFVPDYFRVCFCPRANQYIENRLPDPTLVRQCRAYFALGTDSMASNDDLNILHELNFMQKHYPFLSLEELLSSVTRNGAILLGQEHRFGYLKEHYTPGLIEVYCEKNQPLKFLNKLA